MVREEQIANASKKWYSRETSLDDTYHDDAFCMGAEWADEHPNWHKVSEELPREGMHILVHYQDDTMDWFPYTTDVKKSPISLWIKEDCDYWMEIKLPE